MNTVLENKGGTASPTYHDIQALCFGIQAAGEENPYSEGCLKQWGSPEGVEYYGNHSTSLAALQSLCGNTEASGSCANFVPGGPLATTDISDSGFGVNYETPQVGSAVSHTTSELEILKNSNLLQIWDIQASNHETRLCEKAAISHSNLDVPLGDDNHSQFAPANKQSANSASPFTSITLFQ
jgi:hypothetical protein